MDQINLAPERPAKAVNHRFPLILLIIAALIITASYFLPWLATGIPGQDHAVFSVSAYQANQIKEENFTGYVAANLVKDYLVDSISAAYQIEDKNLIRLPYNVLVNEGTIKKIQPYIISIESTRARISTDYLAKQDKFQDIINLYIEAEAQTVTDTIRALVTYSQYINKLGEANIISGQVSKLDAIKFYLVEKGPAALEGANNAIKKTTGLLEYFYQNKITDVAGNRITKAEFIKNYLNSSPASEITDTDKENISKTIAESSAVFETLYKIGEKDIFENIVTKPEALERFRVGLPENLQSEFLRITERLKVIFTVIEQTGLDAITSERVKIEDVVANIKARCEKELYSTRDTAVNYLPMAEESARRILDTLLLLDEKEVSDPAKNRLMLYNELFIAELLKSPGISAELSAKIKSFLFAYDLVNKVTKNDFVDGKLPVAIRNKLSNDAIQYNIKPVSPTVTVVLSLCDMFNTVAKLGSANIVNGKFSKETEEAIFVEAALEKVEEKIRTDLDEFLNIFDNIQVYGKADDLSGKRISDAISSPFSNRLNKAVGNLIKDCNDKNTACVPRTIIKEIADLLPTDSEIAKRIKASFILEQGDEKVMPNSEKLAGAITDAEAGVLDENIMPFVKIQIEDISAGASRKEGLANLLIKMLNNPDFANQMVNKLRNPAIRLPVKYACQNTIIDLYLNCAVAALAEDISREPVIFNNLLTAPTQLKEKEDLKPSELAQLTPARLRGYQRGITYLSDCCDDLGKIYLNLRKGALGDVENIVAEKRLKNLLVHDDKGLVNTLGIAKAIYAITGLAQESLVTLTYGTKDLKWSNWVLIIGLTLLVISIICLFLPGVIAHTIPLLIEIGAIVWIFFMTIKSHTLSYQTTAHIGTGLSIFGLGLLLIISAAVLNLPQLSRKKHIIIFGAIIILLGFFLPWTGYNPNASFTWQDGYHLGVANLKVERLKLPLVGSVPTVYAMVLAIVAFLLMILSLLPEWGNLLVLLIALLMLSIFSGLVFCIPQTGILWGVGILFICSGLAVILIATGIPAFAKNGAVQD